MLCLIKKLTCSGTFIKLLGPEDLALKDLHFSFQFNDIVHILISPFSSRETRGKFRFDSGFDNEMEWIDQ